MAQHADNHGVVSNKFGQLNVADFDPANLHRIASPYLPTIQVRAATHDIDGVTVAVIYVGPPEPPGVAIIVKDGQYPDGNKTRTVFTPRGRCSCAAARRASAGFRATSPAC